MILMTFLGFLLLFFLIGVSSYFFSHKTTSDYLVAGKSVSPALVGLSAIATNNSGFMFIGMIGATYTMGLSSMWLMVGWIFGDFIAQKLAVKQIQRHAQADSVHSFGGLIVHWLVRESAGKTSLAQAFRLRQLIGILTLVFLVVYAAAQLKAGTKATQVLLGWSPETGIYLAAMIIFVYSLMGGLRASIWTDVAQSIVMLFGMASLAVFGILALMSSEQSVWQQLVNAAPHYMNWLPSDMTSTAAILFVIGWIFGGMGVIGQPQIVIRFMTLHPERTPGEMQAYYYAWFVTFYSLTVLVGLLSRLLIPVTAGFDAETALPTLATELMPKVFAGLILAALFAATMSTVDSLVLSCSAALTRDLTRKPTQSLYFTKFATFTILTVAVLIAISNNQTVFKMVLDAWGLLGSAFGPLIIWLSLDKRVTQNQAILMILSGITVFVLFSYFDWMSEVYPVAFGMLAGLVAAWLSSAALSLQKQASR
ncbi:sodium/proline symporter [Hydrogenovibrio sp. JE_KL2]|uniref:sodium/proline symporter n=1 Tax=Hydrogenovibrio sp. JE_KL2 TaxID=2651188 RepID=UPI00128C8C2A|nr:sodium/proline symporter [Hydrogenovibrio sp. JE_KL2]MPQ77259.1 sodium/proline symporter [Hydrogenovibrio sp. JE_KL2]